MINNKYQPAFPFVAGDYSNPDDRAMCEGLTKREWFAGMALQGLLTKDQSDNARLDVVEEALSYADHMLKLLELKEHTAETF